ncbi:MAG TPA: shikimate kinase [Candidatus Dormibacteraeota bacterium]|jgi:adenylate kinase family enzyme
MRRIIVVGPSGAGKTTTGRELGARLGLPFVELDGLFWEPGWKQAQPETFKRRMRTAVSSDSWILDGNYMSAASLEVSWPRADTIVWLDLRRRTTVRRVTVRTVSRGLRRTVLWSGNRESIRRALAGGSIIRWAWSSHGKYVSRYGALMRDPVWGHLSWVRLRSPREVRAWLRSLVPGTAL